MAASTSSLNVPRNTSLIYDTADEGFLSAAMAVLGRDARALIVSDDAEFLKDSPNHARLDFVGAGLDVVPINLADVKERIRQVVQNSGVDALVIVDMRWGLRTVSASANFERWGGLCDQVTAEAQISMVSVYDRNLMIEDQLITAMRGHSHFLAPSGVYDNPFWLPPNFQSGATVSQQIGFVLGRLVPDYKDLAVRDDGSDGAALGANPNWIPAPRRLGPRVGNDEIWKIRCFGRLRIYLSDGRQVKWDIPGSAPKKTKALFAFLLQRGERGAPTDMLSELLWSAEADAVKKRRRLYHAVAMLRKTLGGAKYVTRNGEYYTLVPPDGTWIDIASFEQLCNRATTVTKRGNLDDALTFLDAADRLYSGDLFEDLAPEYFENDMENWVAPKRTWLKDMGLKILRDKAVILRNRGQFRDALENCNRALEMDPTCSIAHAEAMRVFHAQRRPDAISRQYRQFVSAMASIRTDPESNDLASLQVDLLKTL